MYMIKYFKNTAILAFFMSMIFVFQGQQTYASHIVGGELTYRSLGNNRFEFTLAFYFDCQNAFEETDFDDPAWVWILDPEMQFINKSFGFSINGVFSMRNPVIDSIIEQVPTGCIPEEFQNTVCVQRGVYKTIVTLRPDQVPRGGFNFLYQRCCRNITLSNIDDPLFTGMTLVARMTEEAYNEGNSSPVLNDFPPLYFCNNEPILIDQSGVDLDGDSIVYNLCTPYQGLSFERPISFPPNQTPNIPLDPVSWLGPTFSLDNKLGNQSDPLTIDPQTGLITGAPGPLGQFLVGVCIDEYRDGIFIGSHRRDFQINVVNCIGDAIADFEAPDIVCDSFEVRFINKSIDSDTYQWFVDDGGGPVLFSEEEDPTYIFPDTGKYWITLVASQDTFCYDTLSKEISIQINGLIPDFEVALEDCRNEIVLAPMDLSQDTIAEIESWYWVVTLEDTILTSDQQNPVWLISTGSSADICLYLTSTNGCTDSLCKLGIEFNIIDFEFLGDTVEVCPFELSTIVKSSDSSLTYTWSPKTGLDLTERHNPIVSIDSSIWYYVTVTDGVCVLKDSVFVKIKELSDFNLVDLADSCDLIRIVVAEAVAPGSSKWYRDSDYTDLILEGSDTLRIEVPFTKTVYWEGLDSISNCSFRDSIDLISLMVNLQFTDSYEVCQGDSVLISLTNLDPNDTLTIQWEVNSVIKSDLFLQEIIVHSDSILSTWLYFNVKNQHFCTMRDSIYVEWNEQEDVSFEADNVCGELEVRFTYTSDWTGNIFWDFGDGTTVENVLNPVHTYQNEGVYTVTLYTTGFCADTFEMELVINEFDVFLESPILGCFGGPVTLNIGGDTSLVYQWSPEDFFEDPTTASPSILVEQSTQITVIIFDPNADTSCVLFDTIDIFVPPIFEITSIPDTLSLCEIRDYELTVIIDPDTIPVTIQWFDDNGVLIGTDSVITVVPGQSEYYDVVVTDTFDCVRSKRIPVVFDLIELEFEFSSGAFICIADTSEIYIRGLDPDREYIIEWQDNDAIIDGHRSDTLVVFVENTTTFVVAITNDEGCTVVDSVTVSPRDLNLLIECVVDPSEVKPGETVMLDVLGGEDNWDYFWTDTTGTLSDPFIRNPIAMPIRPTQFSVTVVDEYGCEGECTTIVETTDLPCEEPYVFIPNAFTPNGDGENDVLYVRGLDIDVMLLVIYNRWGEEVFRSNRKNDGWDGTFKGKELPPDVYAYHLYVLCIGGDDLVLRGNISLLR
jgi:gliding motility-associated-like protein